jgi:hypothetical protein
MYIFRIAPAFLFLLIISGKLIAQDFPGFHIYSPESDSIIVLSDPLSMDMDSLGLKSDSTLKAAKINPEDTIERFHSGFFIKVDYGKLLTLPSQFESKLEGSAGFVIFRRIVVNATYGTATLDPLKAYKNVEFYTIEGNYLKFGLEHYFIVNPKNFFTLGAKYAMGNYSDEGKFLIGSEFWDEYGEEFGSSDLKANWIELVMDTETYLAKNLYLGAQFSLRIMINFDSREDIPVYAIPGYGRTFDKTVPAASLYIKYKIPFN